MSNSIFDKIDPEGSVFDGPPPFDDLITKPQSTYEQRVFDATPAEDRPRTIGGSLWNLFAKSAVDATSDTVQGFNRALLHKPDPSYSGSWAPSSFTPHPETPAEKEARLEQSGIGFKTAKDWKQVSDVVFPSNPRLNQDILSKSVGGAGMMVPALAAGAVAGPIGAGAVLAGSTGNAERERALAEGATDPQADLQAVAAAIVTTGLSATLGPLLKLGQIGTVAARKEAPAIVRTGADRLRQLIAENPGTSSYVESTLRSMAEAPIQNAAIDAASNATYNSDRSPLDIRARLADMTTGAITSGYGVGAIPAAHAIRQRAQMRRATAAALHAELQRPQASPAEIPIQARAKEQPVPPRPETPAPITSKARSVQAEPPLAPQDSPELIKFDYSTSQLKAPATSPANYTRSYIFQEFGPDYQFQESTLPAHSNGIASVPDNPKVILIDPARLRQLEAESYDPASWLASIDERIWEVQRGDALAKEHGEDNHADMDTSISKKRELLCRHFQKTVDSQDSAQIPPQPAHKPQSRKY